MTKVSVLIPLYNHYKELPYLMMTLLQAEPADFVIDYFIVNDGSTDGIVNLAWKDLGRLHFITTENSGICVTSNRLIREALNFDDSRWIVIVDPDDLVTEDFFKVIDEDYSIILSAYYEYYENNIGAMSYFPYLTRFTGNLKESIIKYGSATSTRTHYNLKDPVINKAFRELSFNENLKIIGQDSLFLAEIIDRALEDSIKVTDIPTSIYMIHSSGLSQALDEDKRTSEQLKFYLEVKESSMSNEIKSYLMELAPKVLEGKED